MRQDISRITRVVIMPTNLSGMLDKCKSLQAHRSLQALNGCSWDALKQIIAELHALFEDMKLTYSHSVKSACMAGGTSTNAYVGSVTTTLRKRLHGEVSVSIAVYMQYLDITLDVNMFNGKSSYVRDSTLGCDQIAYGPVSYRNVHTFGRHTIATSFGAAIDMCLDKIKSADTHVGTLQCTVPRPSTITASGAYDFADPEPPRHLYKIGQAIIQVYSLTPISFDGMRYSGVAGDCDGDIWYHVSGLAYHTSPNCYQVSPFSLIFDGTSKFLPTTGKPDRGRPSVEFKKIDKNAFTVNDRDLLVGLVQKYLVTLA